MRWAVLALAALACGSTRAQTPAGDALGLAEAVRQTLARDLAIQRQTALVAGEAGALLVAQSAFETRVAASAAFDRERAPLTALQRTQFEGVTGTVSGVTGVEVSLQRRLRSGLVVRPSVSLTRSGFGVEGTLPGTDTPVFPIDNLARVELEFTQPLLSGRGAATARAREQAAALGVARAERQRDVVAAGQVLATVLAYWDYRAATEQLEIAAASEARAVQLLDETERLVAADRRPRAALDQLRADRADKAATRLLAAQAVASARSVLGRAVGLDEAEARRLPPPATPFAVLPDAAALAGVEPGALRALALDARADLAAQRRIGDAAEALALAAERDRPPRLDLSVAVGYTGVDGGGGPERFVTPVVTNVGGLNVGASLRYDLPVGHRQTRGAYAQARAAATAAGLAEADLRRQIELDVDLAWQELTVDVAALALIEEAVGYHADALANERARFEQGLSTLFTVVLFQDRLTRAQTQRIAAQLRVASALARLRFETGTLPAAGAPAEAVTLPSLVRLPVAP